MKKRTASLTGLVLCFAVMVHATTITLVEDSFNSDTLDTSKWRLLERSPAGALVVGGQHLNYVTDGNPSDDDYAAFELAGVRPGYDQSWEVTVNVTNSAARSALDQYTGVGLAIRGAQHKNRFDEIFLELGNENRSSMRFVSNFVTNDQDTPNTDAELGANGNSGSLRIAYDGATKVFSLSIDRSGSANDPQWELLASYGIAGSGGQRNTDWNMSSEGTFIIALYGLSGDLGVAEGEVTLDDFRFQRDNAFPWLGAFDDRHFDQDEKVGWIRHAEHGWLYASPTDRGVWFWDHIQSDWLWTRDGVYPFLFSHNHQDWLFYEEGGTTTQRWFFFYDPEHQDGGEWRSVPL